MINIVLIDDNSIYAEVITHYLQNLNDVNLVNVYTNYTDFATADIEVPDIILLDINLPDANGAEVVPEIKSRFSAADIIMLTVMDEISSITLAFKNGAVGYLVKKSLDKHLSTAIYTVYEGEYYLDPRASKEVASFFKQQDTAPVNKAPSSIVIPSIINGEKLHERERQVAMGLVDGLSYKLIADRYHISLDTVRFYIRSLYKKLNVHSKNEAIMKVLGHKK